jgi:AraC-like DNA-binding protein
MVSSFPDCNHIQVRTFVKNFWQMEGNPTYQMECILPTGEIELIFSFGNDVGIERSGAGIDTTPRCFVSGINNTPIRLRVPGFQSFFGVVLHPACVRKLLAVPSGVFLNAITDLELIDKGFSSLWHEVAECAGFEERVKVVEQWVIKKISNIHQQEMSLSQFFTSPAEVNTVTDLASTICYSPRQLQRKAQELFGMTPEVLLRYKRYRRALHHLHVSDEMLTHIAYQCGYYDQAHFNREFKDFTGLTPGAYRRQRSRLPGHLYQ